MGELEQERQESTLSDGSGEFEEFELALSAERVITAYDENDELTHVVITERELAILQAAIGYAPELVRCAPQGFLQVWYAVDDVCKSRGWNWSRESPTLTYCKIYARPDGTNEPYVRIDFDAEGVGSPDYLNFFDTGDPRTRDKWADASSFIGAVKDLIFIGLGYGAKTPFLESYFERLIKLPDSTVDPMVIKQPQEHPNRAAKKDKILDLWKGGHNLTDISSITGIPYSTLKVYRDELIDEGKLPREAKKSKKGLGRDSI